MNVEANPPPPGILAGPDSAAAPWQADVFQVLKAANVRQMSFVPDAGHARLIEMFQADPEVQSTVLSTEEEGVALAAGAWLGGERSVLLMQSSGVGNCINMLSLMETCRFPFLTLVTMRGEWAEFNPWQVPMSRATAPVFEAIGVKVMRVERSEHAAETVEAAAALAFEGEQRLAVLFSQRMLGRKKWVAK
jgi:sulfopyruvate decarboxylase alpha subunit